MFLFSPHVFHFLLNEQRGGRKKNFANLKGIKIRDVRSNADAICLQHLDLTPRVRERIFRAVYVDVSTYRIFLCPCLASL